MKQILTIERETNYINCETGELYEDQTEAVTVYSGGTDIQVIYRTRYLLNGEECDELEWSDWQDGPRWFN